MKNKLKYFREKAGLTRAQLAETIGVDRTIIWRYENNKCQPRDEIKIRIAQTLNESVENIFFSQCVACNATNNNAVNQ